MPNYLLSSGQRQLPVISINTRAPTQVLGAIYQACHESRYVSFNEDQLALKQDNVDIRPVNFEIAPAPITKVTLMRR